MQTFSWLHLLWRQLNNEAIAVRGSKPTVSEKPGKTSRLLLPRAVVLDPRLIIPRPMPVSMNVSQRIVMPLVLSPLQHLRQTTVISTGLVLAPVNSRQAM